MKILFIESDQQYLLGLPAGFRKQGCQVKILNDIREDELDRVLEEYRPDLVFTAGWTKIHTKEKLEILGRLTKKHGTKQAYWSTEDPRWTEKWSLPYIKATNPEYIFTIDRASLPFYREQGYNAYHLPWACNPEFHRPTMPQKAYQCDIAVIATAGVTWNSYRKNSARILLKPLVEKGYNVKIWGKRWDKLDPNIVGFKVKEEQLQGKLPYLETNHVYSSAKIILGFQNSTTELTARTFEIMGARGCLLAPATRAVLENFVAGKHLIVSRSADETLRLIDHYLSNEEERMKIALEGQMEVYTNHTYSHRAAEIINKLN
ncbi:CgeB family protein [Desulfolucanica intricata]|uniref:CgeB family protein n=1 Tax=Desulfolucanica intricata TaxID=1285191 RepID=UPI00082B4C14|nr:glycosyltransferase [Desulfolucanica intricata]